MATNDPAPLPEIAPGVEQARELDRVVNDPIRLMILGILHGTEEMNFKLLQALMKLTPGNLGSQMAKLEEASYVQVRKSFKGKIPSTSYSLTPAGEEAIALHMQRLEAFKQGLQRQDKEKRRRQQKNSTAQSNTPQLLPGV